MKVLLLSFWTSALFTNRYQKKQTQLDTQNKKDIIRYINGLVGLVHNIKIYLLNGKKKKVKSTLEKSGHKTNRFGRKENTYI